MNTPRHILIVEDSVTQAMRLEYLLHQQGYTTAHARSGAAALETLHAHPPNLILSEVLLPDMSGYEVCRQIRATPSAHTIAIILLAPFVDVQEILHALHCRADNLLVKPYDEEFLLSHIRDTLENQERWQKSGNDLSLTDIVFDGQTQQISTNSLQLSDLLLTTYDAAVRKNRDLHQAQTTYLTLLEKSNDAVIVLHADGMVQFVNPAAERLFQRSRDEFLETPFDFPIQEGKHNDITIAHTDGSMALADLEIAKMKWGKESAYLAVLHDMTEHYQVAEEVRLAQETTISAGQAKNIFLATMSHEIRTPMNAVIGMTSLLLDTNMDDQQRDYVETIRNSGDGLLTILNNILDFSEIQSGKIALDFQTFNVRECIEEALDLLVIEANEKSIELGVLITADVPVSIVGDSSRLHQVLMNLLNNAIKFTQQGEIVISVTAQTLAGNRYELHFVVRDTGIGIPKDRLEDIFESFTQADGSTTRKYGAWGWGLAISKKLAEVMEGKLWVESEEGKGSAFHFTLQANMAETSLPTYLERDQPLLQNKRMLIVDDNATNRQILIRQAQLWEMKPLAVSSGQEALEYVRQGEAFDLAVLDMLMPGMDGLMLAAAIRQHHDAEKLPLIMLSSSTRSEVQSDPRMQHFTAFLTKPIKSSRLYDTLAEIFASEALKHDQLQPQKKKNDSQFEHGMGERHPLTILLAEDSMTNQKLALHILGRLDYRADVAGNGREAVEALQNRPYDVILMDMQMPEMDGLEATRKIRANLPAERQPRIVALTANAMQGDREMCLEAGMDDYMNKPIRVEELMRVLEATQPLDLTPTSVPKESLQGDGENKAAKPPCSPSGKGKGEGAECGVMSVSAPHPSPSPNTVDVRRNSPPAPEGTSGSRTGSEPEGAKTSHSDTPTKAEEPLESIIDANALDRLLEMTGDSAFVTELIESYLSDSPKLMADLRQALETDNAANFRMAAHTMKSSSADFGAMTLSGYCKELEAIGKSGDLGGAEELVAQAEAEYTRVAPALKSRIGQDEDDEDDEDEEKKREHEEKVNDIAENGHEEIAYHGRILAVDDYPVNRQKLARLLEKQGHTVVLAENGKQALDIIAHETLDLMLLDILMPEMDGYEVLAYLQEHHLLRNLPVIVISALDEMDSVVKCIEMGAVDYLPKPFDPILLKARIDASLEKKRLYDQEIERQKELSDLNGALEQRNRFIRKTFGRYLSDDIVASILESPEGMSLGGEKRSLTIMMTDLRGFTAIGERMSPENVVKMINIYLDAMTEILFRYQGTIDEFIGDAILALFGAPIQRDDDPQRAVACALEMQLAMERVNTRNQAEGFPDVAMGIGINTGDAVVGNIGSSKRTKYGIVGRNVNLTARIESYTVGGQIMVSESTLEACGPILRIDSQMQVMPKGVKQPITIYEIGGIGGEYNIVLPEKQQVELVELSQPIDIEFIILEGKHAGARTYTGKITGLHKDAALLEGERSCRELTNLKLSVFDEQHHQLTDELYAKVKEVVSPEPPVFRIYFTSVPPETDAFFKQKLA